MSHLWEGSTLRLAASEVQPRCRSASCYKSVLSLLFVGSLDFAQMLLNFVPRCVYLGPTGSFSSAVECEYYLALGNLIKI